MPISNVPPLPGNVALFDVKTGFALPVFMRYFNDAVQNTVNALVQSANNAAAAEAAQDAADAANAAAVVALDAADGAAAATDAVTASSSLANSYTTGMTVSATDAGASATITISAHTRVYGDGTSVAVAGGALTGEAYSTDYWIIYVDAARAGGAVTYIAMTTIQGNGTVPDGHFVTSARTPAALGAPVSGNPVLPPGANVP